MFGMKRREFITLLGDIARARQPGRIARIGYLGLAPAATPFRAPILLCAALAVLLSPAAFPSFAADADNTQPDLKSIKANGTLRIAITHFDIPPFHVRRADGTYVGKDIEFARELGDALKVKIVFVDDSPTFNGVVDAVATESD